jgi:hypothetical protein
MDRRTFLVTTTAWLAVGCAADAPVEVHTATHAPDYPADPLPTAYNTRGDRIELRRSSHEVVRFDADGNVRATIGGLGTDANRLNGPRAIALAPNDDVWVLDRGNRALKRFAADGTLVTQLDAPDTTALAVGSDGTLVTADAPTSSLRLLRPDGAVIRTTSLPSPPRAVAVGPDGTIVAVLLDGSAVSVDGDRIVERLPADTLVHAVAVAIGPDRTAHIADASGNRVVVVGPTGAPTFVDQHLDDARVAQPLHITADAHGIRVTLGPGEA